ncbi:MAG: stage V sporulation protein AC [Oscillospiraceae bacterium]|nr:stage V sporulation protein AC [Oscillospiraceae bacterium]
MSNEEYKKYAESRMPRSHMRRDALRAFWVGGLICMLGQLFIELYTRFGLDKDSAGAACSVTLIFIGAVLTGLGIYDKIAKFAGAGTLVPITGFSNSVVAPALEFKTEGMVLGTAAKMFIISGPVIVFGTSASVVYGIILFITGSYQ